MFCRNIAAAMAIVRPPDLARSTCGTLPSFFAACSRCSWASGWRIGVAQDNQMETLLCCRE